MKKLMIAFSAVLAATAVIAATVPPFVAHRGESVDAPENTVAAFSLAASRGLGGVECDVYTSSDGVPICLHDSTFQRTCGVDSKPGDLTWAQIREIDATYDAKWTGTAYDGEKVPSLAQYLEVIAANNVFAFIEIKSGDGVVGATVNAVTNAPGLDLAKVQFIAFNANHVKAVRQYLPQCKAHLLTSTFTTSAELISRLAACNASGVDIEYTAPFTAADVAAVKAAGYDFHVWTVNNATEAARAALKGVDSITTDKGLYLRNNIEAEFPAIIASDNAAAALLDPTASGRETIVIAPGNGVATNVAEKISGDVNVQINPDEKNGGMVTLSAINDYFGFTYVKSGKLSVGNVGGMLMPSAIGATAIPANSVIIGNGTFNFTGATGATDRDFIFLPDPGLANAPGVIDVDEGCNLRVTGKVTGFNNGAASFAKVGQGTFTIATQKAYARNEFKRNPNTHGSPVAIKPNGDSMQNGVSCFNVLSGRVVIDTSASVTNVFGNETLIGSRDPTRGGAHLDVMGGTCIFPDWLAIARSSGDSTTNPEEDFCSVNVHGGLVSIGNLGFAYCQNNSDSFNPRAVFNVSGGVIENINTLRVDHTKSRAVMNISGGLVSVNNSSIAHYNPGAQFTLNLSGGEYNSYGTFEASRNGNSVVRFNLTGGKFACGTLTHSMATDTRINASGVDMTIKGDWKATGMTVGPQPVTLNVSGARTIKMPVAADGAEAAIDISAQRLDHSLTFGGAVGVPLRVAAQTTVAFGGNAVTAPITLGESACLRVTAATTLPDVRMGTSARLAFAGAGSKLTLNAWQPSGVLSVTLADAATAQSVDLVTFPSSVNFDPANAVVANPAANKSYAFSVRNDGATKTLVATVSNGAAAGTAPVGYTTRLYQFNEFAGGTVSGPITVTGTRNHFMGVDVPEGETLTFAGGLQQQNGGFGKLGGGELRLTGPYDYNFAKDFGMHGGLGSGSILPPFDANGASLNAYAAFIVYSGTLRFGAPGQSFAVNAQEMWVGTGSQTTGVQPDAAIVQEGGDARVTANFLVVGRNPGYWKSATENTLGGRDFFNSSYTMHGGSLDVQKFILGYDNDAGAPQRARFEMFGGSFRQSKVEENGFRIGGAGHFQERSEIEFIMHGGTAEINAPATFPHWNMKATLCLTDGAEMTFNNDFGFNSARPGTVLAITNSTLRFGNRFNGNSNIDLIFDGATLVPGSHTADINIENFKSLTFGEGGLTIDTSRMTAGWFNVRHPLRGTGVLRVRGDDTDRSVCLRGVSGGHGCPIEVEYGGAVSVDGNGSADCTALVRDGGAIWKTGDNVSPVASLTLGDDGEAVTALYGFDSGNGVFLGFKVGALTVNGAVRVGIRRNGTTQLAVNATGSCRLLTAPRGSIDASKFTLDPRMSESGVTASIGVEQNADGTDTLVVGFSGTSSHAHVWAAGDGAWGEAANWANGAMPEDVRGDPVTFPATLAGDVNVNLGGDRTVGKVTSLSRHDVSLTGGTLNLLGGVDGVSLESTGGGTLSVGPVTTDSTSPTLTVRGRVALNGTVRKMNDVTVENNSTLSGEPGALSGAQINLGNAWLRPTADGVISSRVTATGNGLFVDVPEGVNAALSNIGADKPFVKIGRGTLAITKSGSFTLANGSVGDINAGSFTFPTNGTTPVNGTPAVGIYGGRVVMGYPGQTITVNGNEFWVGGHPVMEPGGTTADVQLDVMGGTLNVQNFFGVGRTRSDVPTNQGMLTRRPNYTYNQHDGTVKVNNFLMNYCTDAKLCVHSEVNIHAGLFSVLYGRFAIGHHRSSVTIGGKGNEAVFNQYGGVVESKAEHVWVSGYSNGGYDSAGDGGTGELNLFGGVFDVSKFELASRPTYAGDYGIIRLCGGTLKAQRLWKKSGAGSATLVLNGGTFAPTADRAISGFDVCVASTNATAIDVSLVETHTLDQVVAHDPELGETVDGGLIKRGHGRLVVKKDLTMTGPLAVYAGAVDLDGRSGVALAALAGCGAVENGSVRIGREVEPKADGASHGYGVSLSVEAIAFGAGATWKVGVVDAEAGLANRLDVGGAMTAAGKVTVDFGRTVEEPLPNDFRARIGSVGAGTELPSFTCVNTGISSGRRVLVSRIGETDVYARAVPLGTVLLFR